MSRLQGKVAVVTGASLGIGAAVARKLASDGAAVVVNYARSEGPANALVNQIREEGGRAIAVKADLKDEKETEQLFAAAIKEYGQVDILVNNAGVYEFAPITEVTAEQIDRIFSVNVKGLLLSTREAVKRFNGNGGTVINVSSVVATGGVPNTSVYSGTKGAVDSITRILAAELGPHKVSVNAVSPGPIDTEGFRDMDPSGDFARDFVEKTPLGRIGRPEDVANVVSFLASADAGWVTGQVISVSGGLRA